MESSEPVAKPEVTNHLVEDAMRRGARGSAESLVALQDVIDHYEVKGKPKKDIDEVREALKWAEQEAWKHKHLKVFDLDVKRYMRQALRGEEAGLSYLRILAQSNRGAAKEAWVVFRFVQAKLGLND